MNLRDEQYVVVSDDTAFVTCATIEEARSIARDLAREAFFGADMIITINKLVEYIDFVKPTYFDVRSSPTGLVVKEREE